MAILSYENTTFGNQECELNLAELYPACRGRSEFQSRLSTFIASDPANAGLFHLSGDRLKYCTEVFASERCDDRPPLLLLLGNPASHSIASGMAFASEGSGREHRFWKILREVGFLSFAVPTNNAARRQALLEHQYASPFRTGLAVFYSFPSPASGQWSGVSGLRKLFRSRAFEEIRRAEEHRIAALVRRFLHPEGSILAFQKDAYESLRSPDSLPYSIGQVKAGLLSGRYKLDETIRIACAPPTRIIQSRQARQALLTILRALSSTSQSSAHAGSDGASGS